MCIRLREWASRAPALDVKDRDEATESLAREGLAVLTLEEADDDSEQLAALVGGGDER